MNNKLTIDKIQTEITNKFEINNQHNLKYSDETGLIITTKAMSLEKLKSLPGLSRNTIKIIKQNYSPWDNKHCISYDCKHKPH